MSILSTLHPFSETVDVFSIADAETGEILFRSAQPLRALITERSKLMQNPREDGTLQVDHKIDEPIVIEIPMIISKNVENAATGVIGGLVGGAIGRAIGGVTGSFIGNEVRNVIGGEASYRPTYEALRMTQRDARQLIVQTKTFTHRSMFIESLTRQEDPDYFDALRIIVRLKEAIIIAQAGGGLLPANVLNQINSSSIARGIQNILPLSAQQNSALGTLSRLFGG